MPDLTHTLEISGAKTSLQARSGELILITGAVGSGKSLWLKRLAGLLPPPENISLRLDGAPCAAVPPRSVRMLFDRWPATWLGQHVGEELGFGLHVRTPATEMQRALAAWDLAELSLSDAPEGLNRLQAVRLSLAAMSLAAPTLALLDNPTASLREQDARRLGHDVANWAKEAGLIVVVACNRWQDWQDGATQIWSIHAPDGMPQTGGRN